MIFSWVVIFLTGISILNAISPQIRVLEKLGFAMPVGIGVNSLIMILLDLFGVPINNMVILLSINGVLIVGLIFLAFVKHKQLFSLKSFLSAYHPKKWPVVNLGWMLLMGYSIYVIYALVAKTLFWPVFIYDSIYGYDFIAKVVTAEGTFNNSIFDPAYPLHGIRSIYPPLVPLAFGMSYIFGSLSSKIVVVFFYISNFVVLYSYIQRYSTHFASALFAFLLAITPEFAAFSALSSPNPPCTFYTSIGLLSLYIWYVEDIKSYFNIGLLCIVLALWTRTESLIFFAGGGLLIFLKAVRDKKFTPYKKFIPLIVYGVAGTGVFIFWQWYVKSILQVENSNPMVKHLYWDGAKLGRLWEKVKDVTFNTRYYGIIVYTFLIILVVNVVNLIKYKDRLVLLTIIAVPWLLYLFIYYQLDTDYEPGSTNWIESGYKRGFFYFLPLLLFYCASNRLATKIFRKYLAIN